MTYIADRDALAKVLCPPHHREGWASSVTKADGTHEFKSGPRKPCALHQGQADALIASGAVIDTATLADDEALLEQVAAGTLGPCAQMDDYTRDGQDLVRRRARRAIEALAAALTELKHE